MSVDALGLLWRRMFLLQATAGFHRRRFHDFFIRALYDLPAVRVAERGEVAVSGGNCSNAAAPRPHFHKKSGCAVLSDGAPLCSGNELG